MEKRAGRSRTGIAATLVVAGTLAAGWWWHTRPAIRTAAPHAVAPARFDEWMKFESPDARSTGRQGLNYIDATLAHQVFQIPPEGLPPAQARELLLDDDRLLLSSGRRLWNHEIIYQPGMAGKFCYLHSSFCPKRLFEVQFFVDGTPLVIYDNQYAIQRAPSYTLVHYAVGPVIIDEYKFITYDDRAAAIFRIAAADQRPHTVDVDVWAPALPVPNAAPPGPFPLLASGKYQGLPLFIYLDAPGFARLDSTAVHLRRTLRVEPTAPPGEVPVAVSFENQARAASSPSLPDDLLATHQRDYNQWFAENVPYFDAPDPAFKKMWFYRWWVVRFNMVEADTPDLKGFRFYEGKLGFDNAITFAIPVQLKELTYLRSPKFALDQVRNAYANVSDSGAVLDPPGSPYWGENYSHWIAAALAEFHRVHPISPDELRRLLPAMARDVRAWLTAFDPDGNGLPQRRAPRVTGYDLDILSYWYFAGNRLDTRERLPELERVDFASFVYANARAVSELAGAAGDSALADEYAAVAARVRAAVLSSLWDDNSQFFYPQRTPDHLRAPIRELHGFFPFTTLLAPDDARYTAALQKFVDPEEFWARFPPVITSLYYYRRWTWEMDGLTRNIAPHPISMGARTALQALKHFRQPSILPAHFMDLMGRYNQLVYPGVNPYDPTWRPNVHEYYSKWEPFQPSERPKPSDISHDFHSMYLSLVVEGVVGLSPRSDDKIELQPMALQWPYFALDRLRYHGKDLTIIWDQPDGRVRYRGYPEGFSLYIDGALAFSRGQLGHMLYDPATGVVAALDSPAAFP